MTIKQDAGKVLADIKEDFDDAARTALQDAAAVGAGVAEGVEYAAGKVKDGAAAVEAKAAEIKVELMNVADGIIVTPEINS